ncbi:glycoside hydrolase family 10 protein [Gracilimonas tropica]|uniref:glycoside hydrolase family 10 protein n=1 Tax=Gracilimonas tropica TaxID=454600 RepID=UPI000360E52C|nr:family 10 glycosylhydrolase [Gracilimonas tropica]
MTKELIYIISLFFLGSLISCSTNKEKSDLDPVIGVWITNVDSDIMLSDEAIANGMKKIADLGFNTVFPVVWNDGYTLYPSDVMTKTFGEEFNQDSLLKGQDRDPLEVIIKESKKQGLKVIPWFEFGFSSSYNQNGGHILAAKPNWAALDSSGKLLKKNNFEWMNALHPEVQRFMTSLVLEVAKNYDVDGIQGDDRLPAMPSEGGYSVFTRELYLEETGKVVPNNPSEDDFLNWKARKLTEYASVLYDSIKSVDQNLIVSFSPSIYPWSKEQYLQDWPSWIEEGAVDLLIPQAYRWDIESYKNTIDGMIDNYQTSTGHEKVKIVPGIIIKAGDRYNGFEYVREAVKHNREKGLDGEVYFFYEGLFDQNDHLGDSLKKYFYAE